MSLTKVQPSALDTSQTYTVNQLTANTVVAGGVDLYGLANGAFAKANVPSGITYTSGTTVPVGPKLGDQWFNTFNNILFEYMSDGTSNLWIDVTSTTISSNLGYATDTVAQGIATAAYGQANTGTSLATAAFASANINTGVDLVQNTNITLVGSYANSAYGKANTAITTNGGQTITGNLTSNAATAFIAGVAAESGVALQMPREGALRNMTNGFNNMYFDVSNGGTTHGAFVFRSSSAFTSVANMSPTSVNFNTGATITGQTPVVGRTSYNVALDTVVTVDNLKFRISNSGGVFPQVASASGNTCDVCYSGIGYINGASPNPASAYNGGYILAADGTWLSVYSTHGMDSRGDQFVLTVTDKTAGKIYRVTYLVTNNSGNSTGYNIIVERIM